MADTPPKSVHITNYYHKNSGGISTSYNALMAAAGRHRRPMRLIVPGEEEGVEDVNEFARIYYVPARKSVAFDKRYRVMMPWQYMLKDSAIRKVLLAEMPDIIEVTDKYTLSMMGAMIRTNNFKKIGRPLLIHFSCERMDDNIGSFISKARPFRWFSRLVMGCYNIPCFDFHIANSPYTAEEFFRSVSPEFNPRRSSRFVNACWRFFKSPRVPLEERVVVCPRGVDAEHFSPSRRSDEARREMVRAAGIPEDAVILLYAGRISPEKNIRLLPEMMKILAQDKERDFRLLIAGAGPDEDWLRKKTGREIPGRIALLGHLDKEKLADFYASADVFVHPNPKEPFGIAPLEAMASGLPSVVPNAGGLLFYATNENTWLVEPKADEFASAVREIVTNDELRETKVRNALEAAAANTRERSTDYLIETYDRLWEDFNERRSLYSDLEEPKTFDYAELSRLTVSSSS